MPLSLSPKQKRLLDYIRERIAETGASPSLRRAARDLDVSHTAVAQTLNILEQKGLVRREGRYRRELHLTGFDRQNAVAGRWIPVPVIGRITAGLPIYAQQEWDGQIVVDAEIYKGANLFALRVNGDSMTGAGILDGDIAICEPRQYAHNGEIVVAIIRGEEATVKRFFIRSGRIILQPENPAYDPVPYGFGEVLVQGKVIGIQRGSDVMERV
jgi:repressor LexA